MNIVILAPAGGRKTQSIIDLCQTGDDAQKRLIVTFTTNGQKVIEERLWEKECSSANIEVLGWYSFLLKHFIYPYVYDLYPGQTVKGLHFIKGKDPAQRAKGVRRYFDKNGQVYNTRIGKLAFDILKASSNACIERLEGIYNEVYFDEAQDLGGNDLEILECLLKSKIKITIVGDVRQSVLKTSRSDRKNIKYDGFKKILWFRKMESKQLCLIKEIITTWRCNQEIINFADSVLPKNLVFPPTESKQTDVSGHDGVFVVSWGNLSTYLDLYSPECYRYNVKSKVLDKTGVINFGLCKGKTVSRVLIYPTGPIKKFLKRSKKLLTDKSASLFYVAITRAVYSVAIVVEKPKEYRITEWRP